MSVLLDPAYGWRQERHGLHEVAYAGPACTVRAFLTSLPSAHDWDVKQVLESLANLNGSFAFIVRGLQRTWAVADRVRGYPLFYSLERGFAASNSARMLKERFGLTEIDAVALHEFRQAGYVTGSDTLYAGLKQLQAGELLSFDRVTGHLITHRYFRFFSPTLRSDTEETLLAEHGRLTDSVFSRVVERAGGRPIWVPLSGGLDSRFILCKLHELGYGNLHAFSYGSQGNYEAKAAKVVAERLGVRWVFVPCPIKECRSFFAAETRRRYADYADFLASVPNYMDLYPLSVLARDGIIPKEAVLVNGQSGDFTTGGHIPNLLMDSGASEETVWTCARDKHFSLWSDSAAFSEMGPVRQKFLRLLGSAGEIGTGQNLAARLYEYWECQERQCKFVVNGQRIYDFLGYDWELPLWHEEYLNFWREIPVPVKAGQRLYKKFLESWDYKGLFKGFKPRIWRWPGASIIFVAMAQLVGLACGRKLKERFYSYAKYFGHYRSQYGVYPYSHYFRWAKVHRNPYSFYVKTWFSENLGPSTWISC